MRSLEQSGRTGPTKKIGATWDPKDPYSIRERVAAWSPDHSVTKQKLFQDEAMGTLVEAIRLAEGRSGVQLGRINTKLPL